MFWSTNGDYNRDYLFYKIDTPKSRRLYRYLCNNIKTIAVTTTIVLICTSIIMLISMSRRDSNGDDGIGPYDEYNNNNKVNEAHNIKFAYHAIIRNKIVDKFENIEKLYQWFTKYAKSKGSRVHDHDDTDEIETEETSDDVNIFTASPMITFYIYTSYSEGGRNYTEIVSGSDGVNDHISCPNIEGLDDTYIAYIESKPEEQKADEFYLSKEASIAKCVGYEYPETNGERYIHSVMHDMAKNMCHARRVCGPLSVHISDEYTSKYKFAYIEKRFYSSD